MCFPDYINNVLFIFVFLLFIFQQMRSAWPLNTLPPQHTAQHINQHGILAHVVSPSVGMAQSQTNTNSPAQQMQDDRRRAEHDRMMAAEREQQEQQRYYVSQGVSIHSFFFVFVGWLFSTL